MELILGAPRITSQISEIKFITNMEVIPGAPEITSQSIKSTFITHWKWF